MSAAVMNTGTTVYEFGDYHYKSHGGMSSGSSTSSDSGSSISSTSGGSLGAVSRGILPAPVKVVVSRRGSNPLSEQPLHRKLDRSQSEPAAPSVNTSRYKTELCRPFEESGECKYGDKCQFAHGVRELRSLARHPKYKTELCRTFHTIGFCPYGPRCHFIHNADEARPKAVSPPPVVKLPPPAPASAPPVTADVFGFSFPSPLVTPSPPPSPPAAASSVSFPPPPSPEARLPVFNRLVGLSELLA